MLRHTFWLREHGFIKLGKEKERDNSATKAMGAEMELVWQAGLGGSCTLHRVVLSSHIGVE